MTPKPLTPRADEVGQRRRMTQANAALQDDTAPTASRGGARSIELTGGESVYCINQSQLRSALRLAERDTESGRRIHHTLVKLERELNRNERAALAFMLIERLRNADA